MDNARALHARFAFLPPGVAASRFDSIIIVVLRAVQARLHSQRREHYAAGSSGSSYSIFFS